MKSLENLKMGQIPERKRYMVRTYSCASCCSVVRSRRLSTSFTGLNTACLLACMAANVTWSWKMGDS